MAPATRSVPVSILSGITRYRMPSSSFTPSMVTVLSPTPWIRAPIAFRAFARSTTSGSIAAPWITVTPSASAAAMRMFSVPPTVVLSNTMVVPFNRPLMLAMTNPWDRLMSAPIFASALRCRSTGLTPMAHPPGSDTFASPYFARRGPRTRIDARMLLTRS